MLIRRYLKVLLYGLLLLAVLLAVAWWLARTQLEALGVEQFEVSGTKLGWNRLAFDSVSVTWTGDGRSVVLETLGPAMIMDWADWQVDRLVARSARIEQVSSAAAGTSPRSPGADALRLSLPDSVPFWLPRHLSVNNLEANFPCQGDQCRFKGALRFDRNDSSATAQVDATLDRGSQTLTIQGDVQLGDGDAAAPDGELLVSDLSPWLSALVSKPWQSLLPHSAVLRFSPSGQPAAEGQWPMAVKLTTEGGAAPSFEGQLVLHAGDNWHLEVAHGRLTATVDRWQQSGWVLDDIRATLPFRGRVSPDGSRVTLLPGAVVQVSHGDPLSTDDLVWLDDLALSAEGLSLQQVNGELRVEGPVELSAGEIRHDALVTQGWGLAADVNWAGELVVDGTLASDAGMTVPLRGRYHQKDGLQVEASMTLNSGNQANQLSETLRAWPGSLTIEEGEARLASELTWHPESPLTADATLTFAGASGLYEEMAWQTLSGQVQASLANDRLTIGTSDLELADLNPGMPIGPVRLAGTYGAALAESMAGELKLDSAEAGFAGGTLSVAPHTWQLDTMPISVPVTVQGLQLSRLMNLYPTEGLAGEGTLEGELPLMISDRGVRIDGGHLSALPPGGRLQLPADKLQAMAATNEAMALVARAMEDFHYEQLESGISYSEDGTLVLDLQLRGNSPGVDSDRPVVLNINLEEDIPALLTSLQLSGRVNEAVTERVRERLQQDGVDTQ
ncbi:YdbH domain-containing protein [Marinobacter bryozoorum]|uniref:intermembrane phospholipid transport protein YdbH family protein n=1 Tax=Marinobacter bryozoorum TaxID=256324 RepID=UPI002002C2DD|nr:YdbH domain-containing protein [Marinobacter bryozoorum]MCK7545602.1 YdbH domain-containing protein [Marinobacter bryozoorum]